MSSFAILLGDAYKLSHNIIFGQELFESSD